MNNVRIPKIELLEDTFDILDEFMDGYFFISSLEDDIICISKSAVKKFNLPCSSFSNSLNVYGTIVHPDDARTLLADMKQLIEGVKDTHNLEYRLLDKDGNTVWVRCSGKYIRLRPNLPKLFIGYISEIGNKNKADNVSGFLTDVNMEEDYNNLCSLPTQPKGYFMSINIDNYHKIIAKQGIQSAENLLKMLGSCIEKFMDKNHRCYRGIAASFTIMNTDGGTVKDAEELFNKIKLSLNKLNAKSGYIYFTILSAGVVCYPNHESIYKLIEKKLSFTLRQSRKMKNNHFFAYNEADYLKHIRSIEISKLLQQSVRENFADFDIYYQPILDAKSMNIIGAEALLRWNTKELGSIPPMEFVPILEETGLIIPVGKWVLNSAIKQCELWQKTKPNFKININLSYVQLNYDEVIQEMINNVSKSNIDSNSIVFEFTESGNILSNHSVKEFVNIFSDEDIHLALDDFGTGYSNFLYLKELKINTIKIDRSFVEAACQNEYSYSLIKYVIKMAHSIDISVCLEGIEDEKTLEKMSDLNAEFYQGFLFSKPISKKEFTEKFILN